METESAKKRKSRPKDTTERAKQKVRRSNKARTDGNGKEDKKSHSKKSDSVQVSAMELDPDLVPNQELDALCSDTIITSEPVDTFVGVDHGEGHERDDDAEGREQQDDSHPIQPIQVVHLDTQTPTKEEQDKGEEEQEERIKPIVISDDEDHDNDDDSIIVVPEIHARRNGSAKSSAASSSNGPSSKRISNAGLIDSVLGLGKHNKLYCSQDHDTGDVLGACSLVVAMNEEKAREHLDRQLEKRGLKPNHAHAYTMDRLPIYRECCFFIGSIYKQRFDEQVIKEDSLMTDRIKAKDVLKLSVYYGYSSKHHVRSGYVVVSESIEGAYRVLKTAAGSEKMVTDWFGLYGTLDHIKDVQLRKLDMVGGNVVCPVTSKR